MKNQKTVFIAARALLLRVISALLLLLFFMFVTRTLTAENSGLFFLSFILVSILSAASSLGFNRIVTRILAGHPNKEDEELRVYIIFKILTWVFLSSLVITIIISLSSNIIAIYIFSKPGLSEVLSIMIFSIIPMTLYLALGNMLEGLGKPLYAILILNLLQPFCSLLIGSIFYFLLNDEAIKKTTQIAWFFLGGNFITFFFGLFIIFKISYRKKAIPIKTNYYNNTYLIDAAIPMLIVLLMNHAIRWSSQLITGVWLPASDVAHLSIATRIAASLGLILQAISKVISPKFAYLHKNEQHNKIWSSLIYSLRLSMIFSLPIFTFIIYYSSTLMSFFGKGYDQYSYILIILSVGYFFNAVTGPSAQLLVMVEKEKLLRNITLLSGLTSIVLSLLFIPVYGITGASIVVTFILIAQNILLLLFVKAIYFKKNTQAP